MASRSSSVLFIASRRFESVLKRRFNGIWMVILIIIVPFWDVATLGVGFSTSLSGDSRDSYSTRGAVWLRLDQWRRISKVVLMAFVTLPVVNFGVFSARGYNTRRDAGFTFPKSFPMEFMRSKYSVFCWSLDAWRRFLDILNFITAKYFIFFERCRFSNFFKWHLNICVVKCGHFWGPRDG